ncbi:MAG: DUF559 domain-containing protein [Actinobacteria bacterium]|nr:DUF559 domain-containing protein [Actinomycetota bacterium]
MSEPIDVKIAEIAARQHGVVTHAQALKAGASHGLIHHRLRTRRWELVYRTVYRLRGTPRSWEQQLMAACLAARDGVVSGRAAAALLEFPGFDRGKVEITTPRKRRFRAEFTVHQSAYLMKADVIRIGVIPVTAPIRTLVDVAALVSADTLQEALDDALVRGLVTIPRVDRWLEKVTAPIPGIGVFKAAIDSRRDGGTPQSVMETRMLKLMRSGGLPEAQRQYSISHGGEEIRRADFVYPAERIDIETDSRGFHSAQKPFEKDRRVDNQLSILGWCVLRFTWAEIINEPEKVISTIRAALAARCVTKTPI